MSLRYALIGMLAWRPGSGYELTRRFAISMAHVWPASHSQIYPELSRLLANGLIEQTEAGPRGRKTYAATAAGIGALREWIGSTEPDYGRRSEADLREFFLWVIPPADALGRLEQSSSVYRRRLEELERIAHTVNWDSDAATRASRLTLEKAVRSYRVLIEWADWAAEEIKAGALVPGGPIPGGADRGVGASAVDGINHRQRRGAQDRRSAGRGC